MAAEFAGYNIIVTCSQDSTIIFKCKAKKRPGIRLGNKIDITTDASTQHRNYEPSGLFEITSGELTVPDDPNLQTKILAILGQKGTITFKGRTTGDNVAYSNAWFASYTPDNASLDGTQPTASIVIESDGTTPSVTHTEPENSSSSSATGTGSASSSGMASSAS